MNIKEVNSKKLFKEYEIQIPYEEIDDSINNKINDIILYHIKKHELSPNTREVIDAILN